MPTGGMYLLRFSMAAGKSTARLPGTPTSPRAEGSHLPSVCHHSQIANTYTYLPLRTYRALPKIGGLQVHRRLIIWAGPSKLAERRLEADPDLYARYRAEHNARALVNTLRAAGIQIVQR